MIADAHPRAQLTVRGWLFLVLFSMGVLVLAGASAGTVLLSRTDEVTRSLSQEIQPARRAAIQLQAAVRDQETGVRGYAIAADRQFLTPYYDGQQAEHAAAEEVRRLVGQRVDLLNDLDAIERATANWRASFAEPLIASVTPHAPDVVNSRVVDRGKAEFDHLRELFDNQNADFAAASAHATDELKDIKAWRNWVMGAVLLVFFALAITLGLLTRSTITLPLASLAAACRRITEGNFTESITPPRRPKDIHDMAIDVENMRQRIVSALDISRASGARLDEQAVELKRSNAELEQFAYVASHDLQEPLRKVASFCQLLEKRYGDQLDERGIEYIGYAVDGAKRMQVLINDLLTFSRVGRVGSKQTKVELDTTLDAALANLAVAIEESHTEIVRPTRPLPQIVGDPTLLTMLWQNLIGNAIKFRHVDRSPRIVIDCESGPDASEWLLTVSDNGIGIAPEFTEKVFIIFQRLHGRGVYAGTGVGLAVVKKIVEYHDGAVRIDTTYTDGTRFEFTLPVTVDAAHQSALEGARQ